MTAPAALVTGSSSGIGRSIVRLLQTQGWDVIGVDAEAAHDTLVADVSDPAALAAVDATLADRSLDAVVCAAGIWHAMDGPASTLAQDVWDRTWAVNVTGVWLTVKTFGHRLIRGGSILTVSSIAGISGMPNMTAYAASKGAIVALTRSWASELSSSGVRVNCICPGVVATPMTERALAKGATRLPLGRPATPEEIAVLACDIVSPSNTYLNGAVIPIDGGVTSASSTFSW